MLPILIPIATMLAEKGFNLLANAVTAKGQEFVEEKLGIKLDEPKTPEDMLKLKQLEMDHEEFLLELGIRQSELNLEAEKVAQVAVTDRWQADMHSDSWLSKNIRPLVLIYLLSAYSVFSVGSAFGMTINESYVALLAQWGMLVMSAYFVGRTIEKAINVKEANK